MANFDEAFDFVIAREGGYVNHPNDPGGPTNFGITLETLAFWRGERVTAEDVKRLTKDEAKMIYQVRYWKQVACDKVNSDKIATLLFDQAVNRGPKTAARMLQKVCGVDDDGVIGPKTLAVINTSLELPLGLAFIKACQNAYVDIALSSKAKSVFLKGWLNRTHHLTCYLLGL